MSNIERNFVDSNLNANTSAVSTEYNHNSLQQTPTRQQRMTPNETNSSHTINIENQRLESFDPNSNNSHQSGSFLAFLQEARTQLERQSSRQSPSPNLMNNESVVNYLQNNPRSITETHQEQHEPSATQANSIGQRSQRNSIRSWRINLNDVFSFSSASSTEALRSLIPSSGTFRYTPMRRSNTNDTRHFMHHATNRDTSSSGSILRSNSLPNNTTNNLPHHSQHRPADLEINDSSAESVGMPSSQSPERLLHNDGGENDTVPINNNRNTPHDEEDPNIIPELIVKAFSHFVRYLPFVCILFIKFIHDQLLGILDLLLLYSIMFHVNKSLKEQVSKFSQKRYLILVRDFSIVCGAVIYRFILANSEPDIIGLLINPPNADSKTDESNIKGSDMTDFVEYILSTKRSAAPLSLGLLLYYVTVNDLVLKLITILVKISFAAVPSKLIRHKLKGRIFVLIEFASQLYRALAPIRQWVLYFFGSYVALEIISGILFSSFYMGAKCFEIVNKFKCLRKALINVLRDIDYERKPTKNELDSAGLLCPICHDAYNSPVVLQCGHIFCDDCVGTWFKREQTCPMCRAKVSDDPTWQDGSTTFFFQLC